MQSASASARPTIARSSSTTSRDPTIVAGAQCNAAAIARRCAPTGRARRSFERRPFLAFAATPAPTAVSAVGQLLGDLNFLPEGHVVGEVLADTVDAGRVRGRVAPGAVLQELVPILHGEVLALALPRAGVRRRALDEVAILDARRREVPVALDRDKILFRRLRDH